MLFLRFEDGEQRPLGQTTGNLLQIAHGNRKIMGARLEIEPADGSSRGTLSRLALFHGGRRSSQRDSRP